MDRKEIIVGDVGIEINCAKTMTKSHFLEAYKVFWPKLKTREKYFAEMQQKAGVKAKKKDD